MWDGKSLLEKTTIKMATISQLGFFSSLFFGNILENCMFSYTYIIFFAWKLGRIRKVRAFASQNAQWGRRSPKCWKWQCDFEVGFPIYECIYIYIHTYCMYVYVCVYVHIYIYLYVYIYLYMIYMYTYIHIYIYTYTCIYIYIHVCMCVCVFLKSLHSKWTCEESVMCDCVCS